MENNQMNSPGGNHKGRGKVIRFYTQKQRVYKAFLRQPKTMLQVATETGIERANICRYVAALKQEGNICLMYKSICPISKCRAGYYTTDPYIIDAVNRKASNLWK